MTDEKPKKKFSFPTAFTILFILLVLTALRPGSSRPAPTTMTRMASRSRAPIIPCRQPAEAAASALKGPINGMYGIEDADRQCRRLELRRAVRRHRRRHVRADHRRLPGRDDEDRRDQRRDRLGREQAQGQREMDVPHPDDDLRHRRHHLRHGGRDAGLLCPDHHRHAGGRL